MEWLTISTSTELVRVATEEILYVVADGNYSDLVMTDGTVYKMTFQIHYFEEYFGRLENNPFSRVNRSLIVNRQYVRVINLTERLLKFGGPNVSATHRPLRVGRDSLKKLKEEMTDYDNRH